jgi:PRTRC genetic system protein B
MMNTLNSTSRQPKVVLEFHTHDIVMTKYDNKGVQTYPVDLADLAGAFTDLPISSGMLPPNTLFWQRKQGMDRLGIYVPPGRYQATWSKQTYNLPMPGFVFVGWGTAYQIYAVKAYPAAGSGLFNAPTPNIHPGSSVCTGTAKFPKCAADTIQRAFEFFWASGFTPHLTAKRCKSHPENVRDLWNELDGKGEFPLDELVPAQKSMRQAIHE